MLGSEVGAGSDLGSVDVSREKSWGPRSDPLFLCRAWCSGICLGCVCIEEEGWVSWSEPRLCQFRGWELGNHLCRVWVIERGN